MLRFRMLGAVDLRDSRGAELRSVLAQPKRLALLTYLAEAPPRSFHSRDTLLGLFWPELDEARARAALSQALYYLRRSLGEGIITNRGQGEIGVDPDRLWCDAVAFERALEEGDAGRALELYRGDFLPGFFLSDAVEWERWLARERARLRRRAAEAAWTLAEEAFSDARPAEAGRWGRRAVALAGLDETYLRRLIALLDRLGDRAGAVRVYEEFASGLRRDHGFDVSPETREMVERVRARAESVGAVDVLLPPQLPEEDGLPPAATAPGTPGRSTRVRQLRARHLGGIAAGVAVLMLGTLALWPWREAHTLPASSPEAPDPSRPAGTATLSADQDEGPSNAGDAHLLYLRGRYLLGQEDAASYKRAREYFEASLERDPTNARAWSGLSDVFDRLAWARVLSPSEAYPRARAAAERALRIDPELAEAHVSLARALTTYYWDSEAAEAHFRRAVELDPNHAEARRTYAAHLRNEGRLEEARVQAEAALELDPLAFFSHFEIVLISFFEGNYDDAISRAERIAPLAEGSPMVHFICAKLRLERGEYELALEALDRADPKRSLPPALAIRAHVLAKLGRDTAARQALELLAGPSGGTAPAFERAVAHLGLGERERALDLLDQAIDARDWRVRLLKGEPIFAPLREEPRFADLLEKAGLGG